MVQPWRTLSSETLLRDRWIDVRADRCVTEDGTEIAPYYVLTYPDWVHVVALTASDELVLVEQFRQGAGLVCLELPGGVIDPGDPDAIAAGQRELAEETGYVATDWQPVGLLCPNPATHTNRVHTVLATGCIPAASPHRDAGEAGMAVRTMPVDQVLAGLGDGLLAQSMQVGAVLLALRKADRISFQRPPVCGSSGAQDGG